VERLRKIKNAFKTHVEGLLTDAGYSTFTVTFAYPTGHVSNPAVAIDVVSKVRERYEIGSYSKYQDDIRFVVSVIARSDGERLDMADIIMRDCDDIYIETTNTSGWSSTNLISNSTFDDWTGWQNNTADMTNTPFYCDPKNPPCPVAGTCPWANRNIDVPQWYLSDEFRYEGTYSAGVAIEENREYGACSGTMLSFGAGTYLVSGRAYRESNIVQAKILVFDESDMWGTPLGTTNNVSEAQPSMHDITRTWYTITGEFTLAESKNVIPVLYALTGTIDGDVSTPCADDNHAAFDSVGLYQLIQTAGSSDKVFLTDVRDLGNDVRWHKYESVIGIGAIDDR